ncbi:peptide deformylase [Candidatus Collierbacteria bacterium]|nr:peptide deformylase [Candidatus Collierbacteria bacterium]
MRILTVPEETEILRRKSEPVGKIDAEFIDFLIDLGQTLKSQHDPQGVGLSAIQVGKPLRVFATLLPEDLNLKASASEVAWQTRLAGAPAKWAALGEVRGRSSGAATNRKIQRAKTARPQLHFYLNPEITDHSLEKTLGDELTEDGKPFLEGCLSIPRYFGPVLRWPTITARAVVLSEKDLTDPDIYSASIADISSKVKSNFTLTDLSARVFQHEIDHLNGVLFVDHTLGEGHQLYQQNNHDLIALEGI